MALKPINKVEMGFVLFIDLIIDTIGLLPVLGNFADFFGLVILNIYFLLKLGMRYFNGKRSGQKIATTIISGGLGIIPVISNFVPELTIQAAAMYWILDKEQKEEAAEIASKAANDDVPQRRLSRAA